MSRREIFLHVGHGKTGTSFVQSALANSIENLATHGIAYPLDPEEAARVRAGGISSGNTTSVPHAVSKRLQPNDSRLLLSSEGLFHKMRPNGFMERLRRDAPDADVRVMLYVRDPLDHAVSKYQQSVKRGGATEDFETFLAAYSHPGKVAQFLSWISEFDVTVTVRNYSRHRSDLLQTFCTWLAVPETSLVAPQVGQVNRSMTNSEIALQRAFNAHFGSVSAKFVSDVLCEKLPHIRSQRPPAGREALDGFLTNMANLIARHDLNAKFGAAEAYQLPTLEEACAKFSEVPPELHYSFSQEQLQVLVSSMQAEIARSAAGDGLAELATRRAARKAAKQDARAAQKASEALERPRRRKGAKRRNGRKAGKATQ